MANTKRPMPPQELREILAELGLTRLDLEVLAGSGERAARKWAKGESEVPGAVAHLMRLLRAHPELLPEAWAAAGMPEGQQVRPRGRPRKDVA